MDKVDWSNPSDKWYGLEEQVGFYVVLVFSNSLSLKFIVRGALYTVQLYL